MTAIGEVTLGRRYSTCSRCQDGSFPADEHLGILGRLSVRARKWACSFGSVWAFADASKRLADICGWKISAQSLKRCCYDESANIEKWRETGEANGDFSTAQGDIQFEVDGTMANTIEEGWKEARIAVFQKQPPGEPARSHQWDTRKLPAATARSVRVALGPIEEFAETWRPWAATLNIVNFALITVLGDGAKWIWNHSSQQFPSCRGVLDIFHVIEHVAAALRAVYGENSGTVLGWKSVAIQCLLGDGWFGLCDWVGRWRERCGPELVEKVVEETEALFAYLSNHTDHLGYCERLAKGQSIGSGVIESGCKYVFGRRIKRKGRWRMKNVVKMGVLCSTHYAEDWDEYWEGCLALAV